MVTPANPPRTKMPKDLKFFLATLIVIPVLLLIALTFIVFSPSQTNSIVTDLELNRFKMKISIQEN